jgi:hypothetical protein
MASAPDEFIRSALLQRAAEAPATPEGAGAGRSSGVGGGALRRIAAVMPPLRAWVGGEPAQELHCDICLDVMTQARTRTRKRYAHSALRASFALRLSLRVPTLRVFSVCARAGCVAEDVRALLLHALHPHLAGRRPRQLPQLPRGAAATRAAKVRAQRQPRKSPRFLPFSHCSTQTVLTRVAAPCAHAQLAAHPQLRGARRHQPPARALPLPRHRC